MGYYTQFKLAYDLGDEPEIDHKKGIEKLSGYNIEEECKWYDHEKDMKKYSKQYPNVLFYLYGEGEDFCDMWNKYFKNGKMQVCLPQIHFDDYDETKLK